jgi:peptide/nickel transport system permease protein
VKTVLQRILLYLLTIWAAITVNFFLPRLLHGNAVDAALGRLNGAQVTPQAIRSMEIAFGLNTRESTFAQYFQYLGNILHGQLGVSIDLFPETVVQAISAALPWTLGLVGVATLISFALGTGLGIVTGWRQGSRLDALIPVSMFFSAMPYFWFGLIVITVFAINTGWFPYSGGYAVTTQAGFNGPFIASVLQHAVLPAVTIVAASLGQWLVGMRNMMVSTLAEDYLLLAEAKGLRVRRRSLGYAARNAILPSVSNLSLSLGFVVSGALVTEVVFQYPGLGFLLFQAVQNRDFPLMQGIFLVITLAVLTASLLADLAYAWLDPRTRSHA